MIKQASKENICKILIAHFSSWFPQGDYWQMYTFKCSVEITWKLTSSPAHKFLCGWSAALVAELCSREKICSHNTVVWKSWLFPRAQSSFRARCWVPMKRLQRSCAKLELCTGLTARAAYLKLRPRHPASVESNRLRQDWVINVWSIRLSCYSTAAVRLSRDCFVPRCRIQRRLCGWEPPGPDLHTTWRFSSARPRITLGYSCDKRNWKWPWTNEKSHGQRFFNT